MAELQHDEEKPTSITRARYQAAFQRTMMDDAVRRRMRHWNRRTLLPPGLIRTEWAMFAPMRYYVGAKGSDEHYTVPKGFTFDGASVPFLLTWLVPRTHSRYIGAAALHDYLYSQCHEDVPRARADEIFREAMLVLGLHWLWAVLMWRGVRAGGWMVWYKRKPKSFVGTFLDFPSFLVRPLGGIWVFVLAVLGLILDVFNIPAYRREAARVAAQDEES